MEVDADSTPPGIVRDTLQDVICDFVDGFSFGDALGFGLRSSNGWWTVKSAALSSPIDVNTFSHLLSYVSELGIGANCEPAPRGPPRTNPNANCAPQNRSIEAIAVAIAAVDYLSDCYLR